VYESDHRHIDFSINKKIGYGSTNNLKQAINK